MPQFCLRKTVLVISEINVYSVKQSGKCCLPAVFAYNVKNSKINIYRLYAAVLLRKTVRVVSEI